MGRFLTLSILLLAAAVAFLAPLGWSFDARNGAGDWLTAQQRFKAARFFYAATAFENNPRGRNNIAVIDYHLVRRNDGATKADKRDAAGMASAIFQELAGEGYAPGAYNRALMCFKCKPGAPGYAESNRWFERAIALGDPVAPLAYGLHLRRWPMISSKTANEKGLRLIRDLADRGDPTAAAELASWARGRDYLTTDEVEAYYTLAAEGGNLDAQEALGFWFENGRQEEWLKAAAKQGSIAAMEKLGERYFFGDFGGEEEDAAPDYHAAAKWFEKAVREAQKGFAYERRIDVRASGLRLRELAPVIKQDHNSSQSAAYDLSLILMRGLLGEPDMEKAEEMLRHAALLPWKDSAIILTQIEEERAPAHARKHHRRRMIEATLHRYQSDFEGRFRTLQPFIERGDIRAVTEYDLARWALSDDPAFHRAELTTLQDRGADRIFLLNRDIDLTGVDIAGWPALASLDNATLTVCDRAPRIYNIRGGVKIVCTADEN